MGSYYKRVADALTESLKLKHPPVAVSFSDAVPASVPMHSGNVPAGCRFWQNAGAAAFATSPSDHSLCAIGAYTHNLEPTAAQQTDLVDALKVLGELGYVTSRDLPQIAAMKSRPAHVIYAPLAETPLAPDVVLMFVSARQALIVSEAAQQIENRNPPAMGRPACAVIPQVMNTGRAALSLGCCGARAYLDIMTEDVALFAIPGSKLATYADHIAVLAQANDVLTKFHETRRRDIAAGQTPTVEESLAAMES